MFNSNPQCYQNISQDLLSSAFVQWASMYVRFRYSGKNPIRLAVFLAYFCAVLRFSDPPYAPANSIMYTDEMFRCLLISLAMLVLYGSMDETQGC